MTTKEHEGEYGVRIWGEENVLYLGCGGCGYVSVYIVKSLQNIDFKMGVYELYPNF